MTAYIIAGAPSPDLGFISANIPADGFVLCADKGYSYALRAGVMPDVIIGDFDSCTDPIPEADFVTRLPREKDYTDTVHCIDKAIQLGYDDIVLFAATGGRLDHTVGNLCEREIIVVISLHNSLGVLIENRAVEVEKICKFKIFLKHKPLQTSL